MRDRRLAAGVLCFCSLLSSVGQLWANDQVKEDLKRLGVNRGVVALIELPDDEPNYALEMCKQSELTVYVQISDPFTAHQLRRFASEAGLLGTRLFVENSNAEAIHLATNLADGVLVVDGAKGAAMSEIQRVLRPRGIARVDGQEIVKPVPDDTDDWSHPYHGPDNNPQSEDQRVRGSLRTQFIGFPKFSPMPEQTVVAGGRIFKAMGHIAHKANQNEMLNTLLCINAYNGSILWKRDLPEGFMLHRNTMIATDDALYMGDHESCKVFDGETGELRKEIKITKEDGISDGPVWKWMAMRDGILYGMVGNKESLIETQRSIRRGLGHWPWDMWEGHDYKDPRMSFGFGRTLMAIDLKTNERLWVYRDKDFLDARAMCMNDSQIYCYSPGKFIAAIDPTTGDLKWKNSDENLMDAIGDNQKAQHYITGYATTCYMKCSSDYLFFAGPQRAQMVVASAHDGKLAWTHPTGNLQLVLRQDGVWAAGPQDSEYGIKFDYGGSILETFPARRACTRATGCADSVFFRANGGTVRVMTESNKTQHIDPMRPPCQDGVIVAGGHLYWGPWMCGCQLSLYGNIALRPSQVADVPEAAAGAARHHLAQGGLDVESIQEHAGDWSVYRGGNSRSDVSTVPIPDDVQLKWTVDLSSNVLPTAAVTAGGKIFVADRSGCVRCLDAAGNELWKVFTGGPIYYAPSVAHSRVYVGSADGRVYAFAAADGRYLWSFRVGPDSHRIQVFDRLISAWPVSGGVVVDDDTVYAAAGITHYDGTYVVGLDAKSGELQVENSTSGTLQEEVDNGISVQGNLRIVGDELQFLAGGVYETASYDLQTLECLNKPLKQVNSQYRTAFYPYYPEYGKYVSLEYECADGCVLNHDASYEGSKFTNLARFSPLPPGAPKVEKEAARWVRRGGKMPTPQWQDQSNLRFNGFVITDDRLLAAGHPDNKEEDAFLVTMNTSDGSNLWRKELPSNAVKGGVSMDHQGNVLVAMENGQLACFEPKSVR